MSTSEPGKLSSDEVEALLVATAQEGEEEGGAAEAKPEPVRRVHGYDFQQPGRFGKAQLEKLRKMNDALAQNATSHASSLLRSNVKTQLVSMEQMKWENMLEEAGDSVVGFVFLIDPFGYRGVVTIDSQFAAAGLERMMGGQADAGEAATMEFTDLDVRVLSGLMRAFLDPLPELWANIGEFEVQLGPFVRDLQTLDLFPGSEDFVQFCFLMQSNVGSGQITLAAPFEAVRKVPPEADEAEDSLAAAADESTDIALRENLKRTTIELAVLLGTADIKVGRLVRIEPGDVIVLDTRVGDALGVRVNDKAKFRAFPGVCNGKLAAQITLEE